MDNSILGSRKTYALIIAFLSSFLTPFVGSSINVALPALGQDLGANALLLGWVPTIYLLALAVFLVPFGRLADIYGRKKVFTYGIIIFTISSFLATFSNTIEMLLVLRAVQGLGSALIFGTMPAIIASIFPAGVRGRALGISITGVFLGLFLGPVLGGFLTEYFTWRSLFLFNVPLGIFITYGLTKIKQEWADAQGESFDWIGSIILGLALIMLMYGLSLLPLLEGTLMIVGGFIGLIIFLIYEDRITSPVLTIDLFRNRIFAYNNVAAFINYSAGVSIVFMLSLYLQYLQGLSPRTTGILLAVQPIMMVIVSPIAGKLSDEINPSIIATSGMIFNAVGLFIFALLGEGSSWLQVVIALALQGMGFALFSSPNTNLIISNVEEKFYGIASATLSTMRVLGQMLGMGVVLFTLSIFLGSADIQPANYSEFILSYQLCFFLFGILSLFGAYISWKSQTAS